ncbi:MAG: EamA family transporter RarD [Granulosicoccaceae bacterium]
MNPQQLGFAYALLAYGMWGSFPLFFHLLAEISSTQVIAQRILWSLVFCALLLTFLRRWPRALTALRDGKLVLMLTCSALLVGLNWWIYVAAVARGEVVASSLGYFMTPLCSVALARIFLKEQMNHYQRVAIALAVVGVLYFVAKIGSLPWVSLSLAVSFAIYGLIRKQTVVGPLSGLFVETLVLAPLALGYLIWQSHLGQNQFVQNGGFITLLLISAGVLTALPLLAFAAAAERLSLTVLGFMMYLNPSLQFFFAITVLGESINRDQLISFCFIWVALIVFSLGSLPRRKATSLTEPESV